MPGMRLDFLRNTSQRVATGKSLPLKQVEALIMYGKPEQRAKVVQKILPNAYSLCLNKTTHHILLTLLSRCDGLVRVQLLYHVRRKISDLSLSAVGNVIVQELLEKLPPQQKKEIAEIFVLNTEKDEFRHLCEHPFGNHVAQKIMEYPSSREVVEENFLPYIHSLAVHQYGQRVVVKYIESVEEGWQHVVKAIFGSDDGEIDEKDVNSLFKSVEDSMTASSLLRHPLVFANVKDSICAHLCEYVVDYLNPEKASSLNKITEEGKEEKEEEEFGLPEFGDAPLTATKGKNYNNNNKENNGPRHHHAYVTIFEKGDLAQRKELWNSIIEANGLIEHLVSNKTALSVAVSAFKTLPESQEKLWEAVMTSSDGVTLDILDVAQDPTRTMMLRAVMDTDGKKLLSLKNRHRLAEAALTLSQNPVSSPVLQKMLECYPEEDDTARRVFKSIKSELKELVMHNSASYLIQSLLQYSGNGKVREEIVQALLQVFENLPHMLSFAQGSRVLQKLLAYASDEAVVTVVENILADAEKEEEEKAANNEDNENDEEAEEEEGAEDKENVEEKQLSRREIREINRSKHYEVSSRAIIAYALHSHACYVIQALLRECRTRQLEPQRKQLMNALKPFVFDLAVSPWAGRVVLDTMLQSGSAQLSQAMSQVVFLKAEAWLSDVTPAHKQRGGGLDPTLRQTLRRERDNNNNDDNNNNNNNKRERKEAGEGQVDNTEKTRPRKKKLYRTLKK